MVGSRRRQKEKEEEENRKYRGKNSLYFKVLGSVNTRVRPPGFGLQNYRCLHHGKGQLLIVQQLFFLPLSAQRLFSAWIPCARVPGRKGFPRLQCPCPWVKGQRGSSKGLAKMTRPSSRETTEAQVHTGHGFYPCSLHP